MQPETPLLLKVRRLDTGRSFSISQDDLRWGMPLRLKNLLAFDLTRPFKQEGDVPYVRHSPSSKWAVRVEVLEEPKRAAAPKAEGGRLARVLGFIRGGSKRPSGTDLGGAA